MQYSQKMVPIRFITTWWLSAQQNHSNVIVHYCSFLNETYDDVMPVFVYVNVRLSSNNINVAILQLAF